MCKRAAFAVGLLTALLATLARAEDAAGRGDNNPEALEVLDQHDALPTDSLSQLAPAATAPAAEQRTEQAPTDDSVRCRLSGICEGQQPACTNDPADVLACLAGDAERAAAVRRAAEHAWDGYRACAWGQDELRPLSCTGEHWVNLSLTMVDSLDTLHLLGMRREFQEAAE
jgi:mannosyl-oligosaccharide alpha-1,2-mannosidase